MHLDYVERAHDLRNKSADIFLANDAEQVREFNEQISSLEAAARAVKEEIAHHQQRIHARVTKA